MDEDALKAMHAGRAYHGWDHVEALLALWRDHAPSLHDPEAVRLAILFHDAVYDPRRGDNEARSAALLRERAAGTVPEARLLAAEAMVRATERHAPPPGLSAEATADACWFLDADLSILGAEPERFDRYDRAIREEYGHVDEAAFRAGRSAVLRGLLLRQPLFLCEAMRARFEAPARGNLARALERWS